MAWRRYTAPVVAATAPSSRCWSTTTLSWRPRRRTVWVLYTWRHRGTTSTVPRCCCTTALPSTTSPSSVFHYCILVSCSCSNSAGMMSNNSSVCHVITLTHNLPSQLSYVSTLRDITQKPKRNIDRHHRWSHWRIGNTAACMCKGKGTSLRTPTVI